jgi:glycosyltransferase involved in cell wall biosynthesis
MQDRPLVSILINNYNYGRFLGEAIDSALDQTYPHVEVVVVDDGSTDNSREVIAGYRGRIAPIFKENGGQASAFNAGFAASQGTVICFLDSDDLFLPDKAAEVVRIFRTYEGIGWIFHPLKLLDESTGLVSDSATAIAPGEYDCRPAIRRGKLLFSGPATSGLCFSRSLLEEILPMPEADRIGMSDRYLKHVSMGLCKGYCCSEQLGVQRIHSDNRLTLSRQRQRTAARIAVLAAYWMRVNFPELAKLADNGLAYGVGLYWRTGGMDADAKQLLDELLSNVPLLTRAKIGLRALYHACRPSRQ